MFIYVYIIMFIYVYILFIPDALTSCTKLDDINFVCFDFAP